MQLDSLQVHSIVRISICHIKTWSKRRKKLGKTTTNFLLTSPKLAQNKKLLLYIFLLPLAANPTSQRKKNKKQQLKSERMIWESRNWLILVASTWIQAFTGTNFDFSSYSSDLKSVLQITQLQLNYLSVASDMGKLFGWCSGVLLMYFPLWIVMFMAAFLGVVGYGFQWLVITKTISLPYMVVSTLYFLLNCLSF